MKGKHNIIVQNRRIQYKFTIERNITVLKGDSATGKTTLIEMIAEYQSQGDDSGISVSCDKKCIVLSSQNWELILTNTHDSIVFIDEGDDFVRSEDFARLAKQSDNYYVIASRAKLNNLPYSVLEVYGIKNVSGNRYQGTKRLYSEFYPLYPTNIINRNKPDCVIVEDSNAGYDFFDSVCEKYKIACISANGNSKVEQTVDECNYENILVIADGAEFGPYLEKLLDLKIIKNLGIYLPESFEWLILKSDIIKNKEIHEVLLNPYDHIESGDYFSWEQFFNNLLVEKSKDSIYAYNKKKINPVFLQKYEVDKILRNTPFEWI